MNEKDNRRPSGNPKRGKPPAPRHPAKPGYAARAAAAKLLSAVIDQKTSLDGMLDDDHGNPAYSALPPADRGLVRAILNSCLRHQIFIDSIFADFVDKPLPEGARNLRHILSIAAAQILFLDVPDHSAVDIAVEQARRDPRSSRFANLVNALLRRLTREKDAILAKLEAGFAPFPAWFMDRLIAQYGEDHARAIAIACATPAPIDLTVKGEPEKWAETLGGTVTETGSVRLGTFDGAVSALPGFTEGEWWVQDAAARIPARLMGDINGKRVADLCAAPGGKTAQLALAGAHVVAVEQSANRLKRLRGNLARLGLEAEYQQSRLEDLKPDTLFDAVLLDAPCSSTGTIRRHPDVLFTKGPEDIAKLAEVQLRLLRSAFELIGPGGRLVFSNCSLDASEGEDLIAEFLATEPRAERISVLAEAFPDLAPAITEDGAIRTTPAMLGGMDGFYACILQRGEA